MLMQRQFFFIFILLMTSFVYSEHNIKLNADEIINAQHLKG